MSTPRHGRRRPRRHARGDAATTLPRGVLFFAVVSASLAACGQPTAQLPIVPASVDGVAVDLPVVQVTVGTRTVLALIDTGTSGIVVSSKLFGVPDSSEILVIICFGSLCTGELWAEALETSFSTIDGIQMIVGMTALGTQPLEIDHTQSVRLGALRADCNAPAIPFVIDSTGRPTVAAVQVAGASVADALVDTGSVYSLLSSAGSQDLPASALADATPATLCTIDGCSAGAFVATSPTMCIDTSCAADVQVKYPAYVSVGISFLSRYRARFDFSKNTLQLCDESPPPDDGGGDAPAEDGGS